jgi:hypothetical protein
MDESSHQRRKQALAHRYGHACPSTKGSGKALERAGSGTERGKEPGEGRLGGVSKLRSKFDKREDKRRDTMATRDHLILKIIKYLLLFTPISLIGNPR